MVTTRKFKRPKLFHLNMQVHVKADSLLYFDKLLQSLKISGPVNMLIFNLLLKVFDTLNNLQMGSSKFRSLSREIKNSELSFINLPDQVIDHFVLIRKVRFSTSADFTKISAVLTCKLTKRCHHQILIDSTTILYFSGRPRRKISFFKFYYKANFRTQILKFSGPRPLSPPLPHGYADPSWISQSIFPQLQEVEYDWKAACSLASLRTYFIIKLI